MRRRHTIKDESNADLFSSFMENLKSVAAREETKLRKALTESEKIRELFNSMASISIPMIGDAGTYIERR